VPADEERHFVRGRSFERVCGMLDILRMRVLLEGSVVGCRGRE
jgi:hypothetical protein